MARVETIGPSFLLPNGVHDTDKSALTAVHTLPNGFPPSLESPLVWDPDVLVREREKTILQLSAAHIQELDQTLCAFKKSGQALSSISPVTFPLPQLSESILRFKRIVHEGCGFFTVRGLVPMNYDDQDNVIIHLGIASYVGDQRALQQNHSGAKSEALLHVCDIKQHGQNVQQDVFLAPGNQSIPIGFHSDNGEIVSLYCWQTALQGGELYLASTWKIYNDLAAEDIKVLQTLAAPWQWQESRTGDRVLKSSEAPLWHFFRGKLIANYQKRPLRGTPEEPRDHRLMPLTYEQEAALNKVDQLAFENAVALSQQTGDINFFNNLALLHARSAFLDGPDQKVQRHLTRLILRDSEIGWQIPPKLLPLWKKYYDHNLETEVFPLSPRPWAFSLQGHD